MDLELSYLEAVALVAATAALAVVGRAFTLRTALMIGAAITRWSSEPNAAGEARAANAASEPNDPLAEIGAAPGESSAAGDNQQSNKQ